MNDVRFRLQAEDPIRREGGPSDAVSDRIRRRIHAEVRSGRETNHSRYPALALALVILTTGAAMLTDRIDGPAGRTDRARPAINEPTAPAVRQLQFTTSGGTRVLWTFHPQLESR
jgi:hypothetical protein